MSVDNALKSKTSKSSSLDTFLKLKRLGALRVRGVTSGGLHHWCEVLKTNPETKKSQWMCYDDTATELIVSYKSLFYEALDMSIVEFADKETGEFNDPENCVTTYDTIKRMLHFVFPRNFPPEVVDALPRHNVFTVYCFHGKYQEIRKY